MTLCVTNMSAMMSATVLAAGGNSLNVNPVPPIGVNGESSIDREKIVEILTNFNRVNKFPARGPDGPTTYQIKQFERGYQYVMSEMSRLGLDEETLREEPHRAYAAVPAAFDFDGAIVNTTTGPGAIPAVLKHFLNRSIIDLLRRIISVRRLSNEFDIYTAWRVGLIEYLLGFCHALDAGYPIITYGWSRRPAVMSYYDPAVRAIFFGPHYSTEGAENRAQEKYNSSPSSKKWDNLDPDVQRRLIIDEIENDLMEQPNFMTTAHLGQVVSHLLVKLSKGPEHWRQNPWTAQDIKLLKALMKRPMKDFFMPMGFSVNKGGKSSLWAMAAGKEPLAVALDQRGLLDDGKKHIKPFVEEGGRGILVEGMEFIARLPQFHPVDTLLGPTYCNARDTSRILDAIEQPYDPASGGVTIDVSGPSKLRTYDDFEGIIDPVRSNIAEKVINNPTREDPVELNFHKNSISAAAPIEQHIGVRWAVEEETVNFLRFGNPNIGNNWKSRLRIGISSGLGMGVASSVPQVYTSIVESSLAAQDVTHFGVFTATGLISAAIFNRTIFGHTIHTAFGNFAMMAAALGVIQLFQTGQSLTFFQGVSFSLFYMILQHFVQRSLIPAVMLRFGKKMVTELSNENYRRAVKARKRASDAAKVISFVSLLVFFGVIGILNQ